jgi:hypothetical protein
LLRHRGTRLLLIRRPGFTEEGNRGYIIGVKRGEDTRQWVLLSYRMPREPSQPRIAVWRRLERLGVARLGDGLIALPAGDRTREQLDWVAEEVVDNGGTAMIWIASPGDIAQEQGVIDGMRTARAAEYRVVIDQAAAAPADDAERTRLVRRLRGELRRITDRDHFPPAERETARLAVQDLAGQGSELKERA